MKNTLIIESNRINSFLIDLFLTLSTIYTPKEQTKLNSSNSMVTLCI